MKTSLLLSVLLLFLSLPETSGASVDHSAYDTVRQCVDCHPRALPTHRLAVPAQKPGDFPVNSAGKMICLTCHNCISGTCILRKTSPDLCKTCHDCTQGMACLIGSAHIGDSSNVERLVLDDCLGCHNGSIAKTVGSGGHPVNTFYVEKRSFNRITDRKVVLIDGKVTCVSCHNPYKSEKKRLVKSNAGSKLCLTCHRK